MSTYTLSSPFPSVPPEIWLQIFQMATYIPGEWDVPTTPHSQGLLNSWDSLQWKPYKVILPLRRTIVQVSRLWWEVGSKVLYTSFRETALRHHRIGARALDHFERTLSSRPALGRFVKRLFLTWPLVSCPGQIDHVLQLCPNALILSFDHPTTPKQILWEPATSPRHVRILRARVHSFNQREIVQMLSGLPGLEILHLSGLGRGPEESRHHGTLRLSLVRLLSLKFADRQGLEYWTPLLTTADLPRLTSFSTNSESGLGPFSIDIWQRLVFFRCYISDGIALKPEIFRSLTHLHLGTGARSLRHQQDHFPFHQLHHLTISSWAMAYTRVSEWKQIAEGLLAPPLKRSDMPLLQVLELEWGEDGVQCNPMLVSEHAQYLSFLDYLESATLEFERLGIQFQEVYGRSLYRMPTPIKDVLKNARDEMHK